jgi:GxxExxY protein
MMIEKASRKAAEAQRAPRLTENDIAAAVVDEALALHRTLGPGLLESVYEAILAKKLSDRGYSVQRQLPIPLVYDDLSFDIAFRADIVVEGKVILEIKTVEKLNGAHKKQLLTYLKLTGMRLGLLLNFSAELMKQGTLRVVNQLDE